MNHLKPFAVLLILSVMAMASDLPDSPEAGAVSHESRAAARTIFWSVSLAAIGSGVSDSYITNQGLYHSTGGCSELNGGDPHPSARKLYTKNLAIAGAAIGAGYLVTRIPAFKAHPKLAAIVGSTFPAIYAIKHSQATARWYTFKNGGCLR